MDRDSLYDILGDIYYDLEVMCEEKDIGSIKDADQLWVVKDAVIQAVLDRIDDLRDKVMKEEWDE